jgi:hypothetical protein
MMAGTTVNLLPQITEMKRRSTLYTEISKGNIDKRDFNRDMTNKKRKIQPQVK